MTSDDGSLQSATLRQLAAVFDESGDVMWFLQPTGSPTTSMEIRAVPEELALWVRDVFGGRLVKRKDGLYRWLGSGRDADGLGRAVLEYTARMKPVLSFWLEARATCIGRWGRGRGARLTPLERTWRVDVGVEFNRIRRAVREGREP